MSGPLSVLFLCTANICRSPAMEIIARDLAGDDRQARIERVHVVLLVERVRDGLADLRVTDRAVRLVQGQMAALNAKASAKFYVLLTAEQKTKYDALGNRGGGGGPGRR